MIIISPSIYILSGCLLWTLKYLNYVLILILLCKIYRLILLSSIYLLILLLLIIRLYLLCLNIALSCLELLFVFNLHLLRSRSNVQLIIIRGLLNWLLLPLLLLIISIKVLILILLFILHLTVHLKFIIIIIVNYRMLIGLLK